MNIPNAPLADSKTHTQAAIPSGDDLLGYSDLEVLVKCKSRTIRDMARRGEFPQPTQLGKRRLVWNRHQVLVWLAAKFDASNAGKAVDNQGGGK